MAITAEQVREAVEKFLPRSLEVSRDETTGVVDQEKVAERALQIARTAILMDAESSLYTLSLAVLAWAESVQSALDDMAKIASNDLLLSLVDEAPEFISDLSKLESAGSRLLQIGGALDAGSFSDTYVDSLDEDISGFLVDNVVDKVKNRNRVVIRDEVKALYGDLEELWEWILEKKVSILSQVDDFLEVDLKSLVSKEVVTALRGRIDELVDELSAANASEQASLAEQVMVDLAAGRSVLKIIQSATGPEGTTVVGVAEDGSTPDDYLQRESVGIPEPVEVVLLPTSGDRFGSAGRIHLDPISGGHGEAVDDGDGDNTTNLFRDSGATFLADGVVTGNYLFLAQSGQSYKVMGLADGYPADPTDTEFYVSPEIPNDISGEDRYLVMEKILGTFFKDVNESFWTEYSDGETESNVVVSGTGGIFPIDVRLEESDNGLNHKEGINSDGQYGSPSLPDQPSGVKWPYRVQPADCKQGGDADRLLGVEDATTGDGTENASGSDGETFGTDKFDSASYGDWTLSGVSVGDVLRISGGSGIDGNYLIVAVTAGLLSLSETLAANTGLTFSIRTSNSSCIRKTGETWVTDGVVVGDYLAWKSVSLGTSGVAQISAVEEDSVVVDMIIDSTLTTDLYVLIYTEADVADETQIGADYIHTDTNLYEYLVEVGDIVRITSGSAQGAYTIESIVSGNIVQVEGIFGGVETGDVDGYFHDPDYDTLFYDSTAEFLTKGVVVGDKLYLEEGSGSGAGIGVGGETYTVSEVVSQQYLKVSSSLSEHMINVHYHVAPDNELFFNTQDVSVYGGLLRDSLAETPGYKLVISTSIPVGQAGDYDLDYDPDAPNDGPEIGLYWLSLSDTLANQAGDYHVYTDWYVAPADDKTWLFAFESAHPSKIDFLDFTDDAGDPNAVAGSINYDGRYDACYLVVGGESYQVYFAIREDPYDITSPAYTIRIEDRVDVDLVAQSWEIWRGLTTDTFKDTTNSPFASSSAGDTIRVDPGGGGETDYVITEVVSSSEVKVTPQLDAGQSGLTYALFNSVKPGMELVTGANRTVIVDIHDENVLELARPLPASVGKDLTWFVVLPGTDLESTRLVDRDPTFLGNGGFGDASSGSPVPEDWIDGSEVHVMTRRPRKAQVVGVSDLDGDNVCEAVILDIGMPLVGGPVSYKVIDFEEKKTTSFVTAEDLTGVLAGDLLTIWGREDVYTVESVDGDTLTVSPRLSAGLSDELFVVCRGGATSWGRYLLLKYLLNNLTVTDDLEALKLHLAEVIADFGGTAKEGVIPPVLGDPVPTDGSFRSDEDDDTDTPLLVIPNDPTVQIGDQVFMSLSVDGVAFSYVKSVDHTTDPAESVITLYDEFDETQDVDSHYIIRNSVSFVLDEIYGSGGLYSEIEALKEVAAEFKIPASTEVQTVLELLSSVGMDRAEAFLTSGDLAGFSALEAGDASYASTAAAAAVELGQSTVMAGVSTGTSSASANVVGVDSSGNSGADRSTSSSVTVPEEVEIRLALADMSEFFSAEASSARAAGMSLDELISRRIYELIGEVDSGLISDTDPVLPWIAVTGSKLDRITEVKEAALAALDYIIDHPDEFEDVESS